MPVRLTSGALRRRRPLSRVAALLVPGHAWLLVAALGVGACTAPPVSPAGATGTSSDGVLARTTTLYTGGDILTMAGDTPQTVEAVVVRDGRIVFAGDEAGARAQAPAGATIVDLAGRTLLPGFIDGYGHVATAIEFQRYRFLRTSDVTSVADLVTVMKAHASRIGVAPGDWIVGHGYDPSLLAEQRHPTARELDAISRDNPVLLIHASGDLGVANHAALRRAGHVDGMADAPGGPIARHAGTTAPLGLLEARALFRLQSSIPTLTRAQMATFTDLGMQEVASKGLTTVTEGSTRASQLSLLMDAAERGALPVDVVAWVADACAEPGTLPGLTPAMPVAAEATDGPAGETGAAALLRTGLDYTRGYRGHLRIAGLTLWTTPSPRGGIDSLSAPCTARIPRVPQGTHGRPSAADVSLTALVDRWYRTKYQLVMDVDADADVDQFIAAVEAAQQAHGVADRRPVVTHCGPCRDDQLEAMKALGIIPSFTSSMVVEGADRDAAALGPERAHRRHPAGTAARLGLPFTIHNDSPRVPWDVLPLVGAAVTRKRQHTGEVVGSEQRLTPYQALLAVTRHAAYALFEDGSKGSLEPGKRADLVILERNPLTVPPDAIRDIRVLETIKDGVPIYRAH